MVYMIHEDLDIVFQKIRYHMKRVDYKTAAKLKRDGWDYLSRSKARAIQKLLDKNGVKPLEIEDVNREQFDELLDEVHQHLLRNEQPPRPLPEFGIPTNLSLQVLHILNSGKSQKKGK